MGALLLSSSAFFFFLILSEKIEIFEVTPTSTELTNTATVTITSTSTLTMTSAVTMTIPPTATASQTLVPTLRPILGYGKLTLNFFPLEEPNGNRVQHIIDGNLSDLMLNRKQFVTVVDSKYAPGGIWYKCLWKLMERRRGMDS